MWIAGVTILIAGVAVAASFLPRTPRTVREPIPWDISRVSATFVPLVGTLAGFSVASTIFLANLNFARDAPEFQSLIGMFVIAFIVFVGAGQEFGMTPNLPQADVDSDYERVRRLAYLFSMFGYFVAIAVSWNALRLLLLAIGLTYVADIFRWVLLFAVAAGATRLAVQHLYLVTTLPRLSCAVVPLIGFAAAGVYRLGLATAVPALVPAHDEPFLIAVVSFVVAAVGFTLQSLTISLHDRASFRAFLKTNGDRLALSYLVSVTVAVSLLWIAVAIL